ncbi:hypothetical protein AB0M57_10915 [Streptomyces sp. NPDC051597]|uniref:hypothetical protein n=1 Tax=Streptomyces sp. NPDC051597 TaxID=3155049 RepID=UPI0034435ED4
MWRWLAPPKTGAPAEPVERPRYELSDTDRAAFAFDRGNIAALARARQAVTAGDGSTAGAPVPDFLADGWVKTGEAGRRAASVHLRRPDALHGRTWRMDHKQLPILVLPPKSKASRPRG